MYLRSIVSFSVSFVLPIYYVMVLHWFVSKGYFFPARRDQEIRSLNCPAEEKRYSVYAKPVDGNFGLFLTLRALCCGV